MWVWSRGREREGEGVEEEREGGIVGSSGRERGMRNLLESGIVCCCLLGLFAIVARHHTYCLHGWARRCAKLPDLLIHSKVIECHDCQNDNWQEEDDLGYSSSNLVLKVEDEP